MTALIQLLNLTLTYIRVIDVRSVQAIYLKSEVLGLGMERRKLLMDNFTEVLLKSSAMSCQSHEVWACGVGRWTLELVGQSFYIE